MHILVVAPMTKNRLMVAFDPNKGPNLEVVKSVMAVTRVMAFTRVMVLTRVNSCYGVSPCYGVNSC